MWPDPPTRTFGACCCASVILLVVACSPTPTANTAADDVQTADATVDTGLKDSDAQDVVAKDQAAGDSDAPDAVDALPFDATGGDAAGCVGGPRCPCASNGECDFGLCIETADGRICAAPCSDTSGCLASETCGQLAVSGGDVMQVCVSRWVSTCAPCQQNGDCAFAGAGSGIVCAPIGDAGSFCTAKCVATSDCAPGFNCTAGVCHPPADTCTCSAWAMAHSSTTQCVHQNAAGTCAAPLTCAVKGPWPTCLAATATPETCNGKDDNCNGLTDDAAGPTCDDNDGCTQDACSGGVCQHLKNVVCGDGICAAGCGETLLLCPIDCHKCGDNVCSPGEGPNTCPVDCCGGCGDGKCVGYTCGENPSTCPQDCSKPCGDGICDKGENPGNCATDCKKQGCGNNICEPTDGGPVGCPKDCAATCGNCVCEGSESFDTCPADCGYCGDGTCSICGALGEDPKTCIADCGDLATVGCTSQAWTLFCKDGSPCTDDICQAGKGCVHLAAAGTCTDGNACTTGDACSNGMCVPNGVQTCDDGNPCTSDYCDLAVGCTAFALDKIGCSDGDACTVGDVCLGSVCTSGAPMNCGDGNACTDDGCGGGVCLHEVNTATCDDQNPCTLADACSATVCAGAANSCDDGNDCTLDSCNGVSGACVNTAKSMGMTCGSGWGCDGAGNCVPPGMALIPAGTFWMGCNATKDPKCSANSDEKPQHKVTLSAYYMDLTETTVGQYKACVNAGGCTAPLAVMPTQNATYPTLSNNPVNYVNWTQSQQYCKWRGAAFDLPTEAQWEMAARGSCEKNGSTADDPACATAMRTYPWGDATATCSFAVMNTGLEGCGTMTTWAVGSIAAGDSPYGLHDMAGNAYEWNRDWYSETYYSSSPATDPYSSASASSRVLRGGAFNSSTNGVRSGFRSAQYPHLSHQIVGLRCMRSYP